MKGDAARPATPEKLACTSLTPPFHRSMMRFSVSDGTMSAAQGCRRGGGEIRSAAETP